MCGNTIQSAVQCVTSHYFRPNAGSRDRYESDRHRDGQRWDSDRNEGGRYRDRYDNRDRRNNDGGLFV